MEYVVILPLAVMIASMMLLFRNGRVYRYRVRLLHRVSAAARRDIGEGLEWEWRYDMLESVSYESMVLKFWRPLSSFYDEAVLTGDPSLPMREPK